MILLHVCYTIYKIEKVLLLLQILWNQMAPKQAHLHVSTLNPTKYELIPSYGFRRVAFTKCHRLTDDANHYYVPPLVINYMLHHVKNKCLSEVFQRHVQLFLRINPI